MVRPLTPKEAYELHRKNNPTGSSNHLYDLQNNDVVVLLTPFGMIPVIKDDMQNKEKTVKNAPSQSIDDLFAFGMGDDSGDYTKPPLELYATAVYQGFDELCEHCEATQTIPPTFDQYKSLLTHDTTTIDMFMHHLEKHKLPQKIYPDYLGKIYEQEEE